MKSNLRIDSNLSSLSIKQEIFHRQDNGPFYLTRMAHFSGIKASLVGGGGGGGCGIAACASPEITGAKPAYNFSGSSLCINERMKFW